MELTLTLVSKLASMMLYVVVGYVIVKIGVLKSSDSKPLSKLVVHVLQPCLIINAFQIDISAEKMKGFLAVVLFCTLVYFVWIFLARICAGKFHLDPIDETTFVYSNVGNLVLPLVSMVLGEEMVFYASGAQIPFNLLVWTHGYQTIRGEKGFQLGKALRNSNVIAMLAGLLMMVTRIRIPEIPATAIQGLSAMVGPTSMMVVGMVITEKSLKSVFTYKKAWLVLFGRLIIFPLTAITLLFCSGFLRFHPEYAPVIMAAMMALSAPPASTISQLAVVFDIHPVEASIYNVLGTFLCIATMPAVIMLFQILFPV